MKIIDNASKGIAFMSLEISTTFKYGDGYYLKTTEITNEYGKTYNNKKKKQPIDEEKSDIQKAIDLLLSTGDYEIFKIEKIVTVKKTQL